MPGFVTLAFNTKPFPRCLAPFGSPFPPLPRPSLIKLHSGYVLLPPLAIKGIASLALEAENRRIHYHCSFYMKRKMQSLQLQKVKHSLKPQKIRQQVKKAPHSLIYELSHHFLNQLHQWLGPNWCFFNKWDWQFSPGWQLLSFYWQRGHVWSCSQRPLLEPGAKGRLCNSQ